MTLALLWPVSQDLERKEAKRVCSEGNDGCEAPEAPEVVGWEARGSSRDLGALSQGSGLGERAARVPAMAQSVERLQQRVAELERELARERSRRAVGGGDGGGGRVRIEKMSPEVVDSNPYR